MSSFGWIRALELMDCSDEDTHMMLYTMPSQNLGQLLKEVATAG